jgi:hypothetical protein
MARSVASLDLEEEGGVGVRAWTWDSMASQTETSEVTMVAGSSVAWIWAVSEVVVAPWESETRTGTMTTSDTMYFLISSTLTRFRSTQHIAHARSTPAPEELLSVQAVSSAVTPPYRASSAGVFLVSPHGKFLVQRGRGLGPATGAEAGEEVARVEPHVQVAAQAELHTTVAPALAARDHLLPPHEPSPPLCAGGS